MQPSPRRFTWGRTDLFRFSAATGNAHRIHYDVEHARAEGLDGVVVHTTLHAMMLWQTLTADVEEARVRSFRWRNHAPLVADVEVEVTAEVAPADDGWHVELFERRCDDGALVASAHAEVSPPRGA